MRKHEFRIKSIVRLGQSSAVGANIYFSTRLRLAIEMLSKIHVLDTQCVVVPAIGGSKTSLSTYLADDRDVVTWPPHSVMSSRRFGHLQLDDEMKMGARSAKMSMW